MSKPGPAGILLISHGDLCKHFLNAARIIHQQDLEFVFAIGIKASQDKDKVIQRLDAQMSDIAKSYRKVIVLCDTHGATASRLVCANEYKGLELACVFGMNLPMLLEAINYHDTLELAELAEQISKIGKEAIFVRTARDDG